MLMINRRAYFSVAATSVALSFAINPLTTMANAVEYGSSVLMSYSVNGNANSVTDDSDVDAERGSSAGLQLNLNASSRTAEFLMDADFSLDVEQQDYGTKSNSVELNGGAAGLYQIIPNNIAWYGANYITQESESVSGVGDSDDRSLVNFFATGPVTTWRLTPIDSLHLDAIAMLADTDGTSEQQRVFTLQSGFDHRLSKLSSLAVHADKSQVSFSESDVVFDILNAYGQYSYNQGLTFLELDFGRTESRLDKGDASEEIQSSGPLYRFQLRRQMTRFKSLNLNGYYFITDDTTGSIKDLQSNGGGTITDTKGAYWKKGGGVNFTHSASAWDASVLATSKLVEYLDPATASEDFKYDRLALRVNYDISALWKLDFNSSYAILDYQNQRSDRRRPNQEAPVDFLRNDEVAELSLGVNYQFAEAWSFSSAAYYSMTDSTFDYVDGTSDQQRATEPSISLSVEWEPKTRLKSFRKRYRNDNLDNVLK